MAFKYFILLFFIFSAHQVAAQQAAYKLPNIMDAVIKSDAHFIYNITEEKEVTPNKFQVQAQSFCSDSGNLVRVSWKGLTGSNMVEVYRDGNLIASDVSGHYFVDSTVGPASFYEYAVKAKNKEESLPQPQSVKVFTEPCSAILSNRNDPFQLSISPNPSPAVFYFSAQHMLNKLLHIEIFNASGAKVYQLNTKSVSNDFFQSINLSTVPAGLYFLKVQIDRSNFYRQIVKQ